MHRGHDRERKKLESSLEIVTISSVLFTDFPKQIVKEFIVKKAATAFLLLLFSRHCSPSV